MRQEEVVKEIDFDERQMKDDERKNMKEWESKKEVTN